MDLSVIPATEDLSEKTQLKVGIPTTATDPTALVISTSRYQITIGEFLLAQVSQRGDGSLQLIRDTFVCIKTENPFVGSLLHGKLFLGSETRPLPGDNSCATLRRQLCSRVGRFRINYHNLVGPGDGFTGRSNIFFLVEGDYGGCDLHPICVGHK